MIGVESLIELVRSERAPDPRTAVFEVRAELRPGAVALVGATTDPAAAGELFERAASLPGKRRVLDEVIRLPDPALGKRRYGIVRSATAPVYLEPRIPSIQITQYVLGQTLELLARSEIWWRVRGRDGYIGWMHQGYLETGSRARVRAWEGAEDAVEMMVSLDVELVDKAGRPLVRLPWGARVLRESADTVRLPTGRRGIVASGELVPLAGLGDWFPAHGRAVIRSARRWLGTPYLWGGITMSGADCSGLVQAVYGMHGVVLPRDSDLQARTGAHVEPGKDLTWLEPGDLLFFAEGPERVSHVAISLGGPFIIHSSLANGGVAINNVCGELEMERKLRSIFVLARRVLPVRS